MKQATSEFRLSHLDRLESESIHILREVAAEFHNPVMLYSVGKDSSVLLDLALKAFAPGKPPFPLLHIDTGWKFKEMIRFRDETAASFDLKLIVHTNPGRCGKGDRACEPWHPDSYRCHENRGVETGPGQPRF